jgi:hypothetical protein
MTQMTIPAANQAGSPAPAARPRRSMRRQRMVSLRTPMPLGLVTLRHDVPEWLGPDVPDFQTEATPKVDPAPRVVETAVRKGA